MALVAFVRGMNVGGHRTFRPSVLAKELSDYDVVNVGGTGTFIVRRPVSRSEFREELLRKLPFEATVVLCSTRDLTRLEQENPFGTEPSRADEVRFVSILSRVNRSRVQLPITIPASGEWFIKFLRRNRHSSLVYIVDR